MPWTLRFRTLPPIHPQRSVSLSTFRFSIFRWRPNEKDSLFPSYAQVYTRLAVDRRFINRRIGSYVFTRVATYVRTYVRGRIEHGTLVIIGGIIMIGRPERARTVSHACS